MVETDSHIDGKSQSAAPTVVELRGVSKTFAGGQRALKDVSLDIARGELHALVGENGSGKSTLIKILAGFYTPDPGAEIFVSGEPLTLASVPDSHAAGLRFVHQDLGLIQELSALDNIGLESGYAVNGARRIKWATQRKHAERLLTKVGRRVDLDLPVAQLRPVERTIVAIARAIDDSVNPINLLVLDEPTAALPPSDVDGLFSVLREIQDRGIAIVYVSHRLEEVLSLADRLSVLRDGYYQGCFDAANLDRPKLIELITGEAAAEEDGRAARDSRPALAADASSFKFESIDGLRLGGVSFEVKAGEILGFAGLDGSGREELPGAITGATPASMRFTDTDGTVRESLTPGVARELGFALVLPNRHPNSALNELTVEENVSLAVLSRFRRGWRVSPDAERRTVLESMELVDVRPPEPDKVYALLSGGNKQKVIFAKWLLANPRLLVLDDPTSGVDIGARHAIYEIVRGRAAEGMATVVCSSDLEDLVELCDRVITLVGGQITAELSRERVSEGSLLTGISEKSQKVPTANVSEG
jgi:ribose transport system ATP-binding protein